MPLADIAAAPKRTSKKQFLSIYEIRGDSGIAMEKIGINSTLMRTSLFSTISVPVPGIFAADQRDRDDLEVECIDVRPH